MATWGQRILRSFYLLLGGLMSSFFVLTINWAQCSVWMKIYVPFQPKYYDYPKYHMGVFLGLFRVYLVPVEPTIFQFSKNWSLLPGVSANNSQNVVFFTEPRGRSWARRAAHTNTFPHPTPHESKHMSQKESPGCPREKKSLERLSGVRTTYVEFAPVNFFHFLYYWTPFIINPIDFSFRAKQ